VPSLPFVVNNGLGLATGNSIAHLIELPEMPNVVHRLTGIDVVRSTGALLTDGDHDLMGLSHRTDILTTNLLDDPDDFFAPEQGERLAKELWWRSKSDFHGFVNDNFHPHIDVAGPQTIILFNGTGATCSWSGNLWYSDFKVSLQAWTLLKTKTSFEAR